MLWFAVYFVAIARPLFLVFSLLLVLSDMVCGVSSVIFPSGIIFHNGFSVSCVSGALIFKIFRAACFLLFIFRGNLLPNVILICWLYFFCRDLLTVSWDLADEYRCFRVFFRV